MNAIFVNAHLIPDDKKEIVDAYLVVEGKTIKEATYKDISKHYPDFEVIDLKGKYVLPGAIDLLYSGTRLKNSGITSVLLKDDTKEGEARILGRHLINDPKISEDVKMISGDPANHPDPGNVKKGMGYCELSMEQCLKAIERGYDAFTDCFNEMGSYQLKDLNMVNALFMLEDVYKLVSIDRKIADKKVFYDLLKHSRKDRICLISNKIDDFNLMIRDLFEQKDISLRDIVAYTSINPARYLGLEQRIGSLSKGKKADLVIYDEKLNVVKTMIDGEFV